MRSRARASIEPIRLPNRSSNGTHQRTGVTRLPAGSRSVSWSAVTGRVRGTVCTVCAPAGQ
ncbi:hypothetical protein ONA70_33005 [Micromonospora yasonensis]|uniref:hypothetical protein n=1 Tax=Micromonospora yasonensis TaxID=1128667 RepID=UPI0022302130|nr:hypothetical protein [Micromonospora yasonensis]MCW3844905.1 hypothetical protein [Micromonospora yasonensis]